MVYRKLIRKPWFWIAAAFLLPVAVMFIVFAALGTHPFGSYSSMYLDMNAQYVFYFEKFREIIFNSDNLLYAGNGHWAVNFWAFSFTIFAVRLQRWCCCSRAHICFMHFGRWCCANLVHAARRFIITCPNLIPDVVGRCCFFRFYMRFADMGSYKIPIPCGLTQCICCR